MKEKIISAREDLLAIAVSCKKIEIVQKLLKGYETGSKRICDFQAQYKGKTALGGAILNAGSKIKPDAKKKWRGIAKTILKIMRENNIFPKQKNILAMAASSQTQEIAYELLEWNEEFEEGFIDFNAEYDFNTALGHARWAEITTDSKDEKKAWTEIVENIFKAIKSRKVLTPGEFLAAAAYCKRVEWMEELLENQDGLNFGATYFGETAICFAREKYEADEETPGKKERWEKILEKIFEAMRSTGVLTQKELLAVAACCRCAEIVRELLDVSPNSSFEIIYNRNTALGWSLCNEGVENLGETPKEKMWQEITKEIFATMKSRGILKQEEFLAAAACCRYAGLVQDLLEKQGTNADFETEYGVHCSANGEEEKYTILGWALFWAYPSTNCLEKEVWKKIAKQIIEIMKSKNIIPPQSNLISEAVFTKDPEIVQMLLDWGDFIKGEVLFSNEHGYWQQAWGYARYYQRETIEDSEKEKWEGVSQKFQQIYGCFLQD